MTAPDPERAVDEARERLYEAFRAFWNDEYWGLSCADAVADFEAAVRAAREPESEAVAYWRTRAEEADARLRIQEHDLARLSKREEG